MCKIFDKTVNRRGTYSTKWDYIEDRFGPNTKDLIPYTISDMDFRTSGNIIEALIDRVEHGIFGYSRWKNDDFLNAITDWYQSQYRVKIHREWITYTPSVIYAISQLLPYFVEQTSSRGIMVFNPHYDGFDKILRDYYVREVNLIECSLGNYRPDFSELERALEDGYRILLLSNPQNPTGKAWTEFELEKIIKMLKKHGGILISDEIHMDINRSETCTAIYPCPSENNIVILNSASKAFNLSSLGGAYLITSNSDVLNFFEDRIRNDHSLSSPNVLGMIAMITAYTEKESKTWLEQLNEYIFNNMKLFKEEIHLYKGIKVYIPEGTYMLWIDVKETGYTGDEIVRLLANRGGVAVMSGSVYGDPYKIRINVAGPRKKIEFLIEAIKDTL